jgi:uncharacterized protein
MTTNWIIYFVTGFVLVIPLAWWGHYKLQGKPGQKKKERQDQAWPVQLVAGILLFVFPLPMLIFYIVYRILSSRLQDIAPNCSQCEHPMEMMAKEEGEAHLTPAQLFDEQIDSYQYEVWRCPACGEIETRPVNGRNYFKFELCPQCGAHAMEIVNREMLTKATWDEDGKQENTLVCQCCGFTDSKIRNIKKEDVTRMASYYDDDRDRSDSSGGGSWGSGSWGSGHSSGGGAGRSF